MRRPLIGMLAALAAGLVYLPSATAGDTIELVPGTAVLLSQSSNPESGQLKSTTAMTNIFSPAAWVDYKRIGPEPSIAIDRYPFVPGPFGFGATQTHYRDIAYQSAPQGVAFPNYSQFWKSDDLAQTFRVPQHMPAFGRPVATGTGGGDSYQAVGEVTHKVLFVDLPLDCVTVNTSVNLGETWTPDELGCGANLGIDDRQWVELDEAGLVTTGGAPAPCLLATPIPTCGNAYVSFINFANLAFPTLSVARSTHDGAAGTFVTDSTCNYITLSGAVFNPDNVPTACPDPFDERLQVAGPVVADKAKTHNVYIPFVRATAVVPGFVSGPPYEMYIARSTDRGASWTRHKVAHLGANNPINIFPQLTIDTAGNLYVVWAQTQGPEEAESGLLGETDIYYAYSTTQGQTWSPPIPLTQESGDSAVFPWMAAGDAGQVDLVYYKSNTGLNPNEAENPSVWNVYFGQSQNALNTGSNFKSVQISSKPNHVGQICTAGLGCSGNRNLLDFFAVDIDHRGAAVVSFADDYDRFGIARGKTTRQVAGASVFKDQNITLQASWPIRDHAVSDPASDVFDGSGLPKGSCPGMDVLATNAERSADQLTISMTLNAPPTAVAASACSNGFATTGGLWGAEFWAVSSAGPANFYIAYRDNPLDFPSERVEAGALENVNPTATTLDFFPETFGTIGPPAGTCFPTVGPPPAPCTITMTVDADALGIGSGNGLYSITGFATYFLGTSVFVLTGNSEHGDVTAALDYRGTGTTKN